MVKPVLSIIIPMYNSQKFIEKALKSIVPVLSSDVEVIIVNDGSTDDGPTLADSYCKKYSNLRQIHQKNGGHGAALNTGISESTGKYIKILDADDWFKTAELENLISVIKDVNADVIISGYYTYDISTHKELLHPIEINALNTIITLKDIMEIWPKVSNGFTIHGMIYRADFYKTLNYSLPEHVFYDDACFITLACSHAEYICLLNTPAYVYRIGDVAQSVSDQSRVQRMSHLETVLKCLLNHAKQYNQLSEAGRNYWKTKTVSFIADYYITALLKNPNRKTGRRQAKDMNNFIKQDYRNIYATTKKRYNFLIVLHFLHISGKCFYRFLESKIYKKMSHLIVNVKPSA